MLIGFTGIEGAEIAVLSRNQPWTKEDDERLVTLVEQGASIIRAAAAFRRTTISVRTRARSLGCPFPTLRAARQKWADRTSNLKRPDARHFPDDTRRA
jgi:hypothetical protein